MTTKTSNLQYCQICGKKSLLCICQDTRLVVAIAALAQVSFYARINHGDKCDDYGEVVDGTLESLGIPTGQYLSQDQVLGYLVARAESR